MGHGTTTSLQAADEQLEAYLVLLQQSSNFVIHGVVPDV